MKKNYIIAVTQLLLQGSPVDDVLKQLNQTLAIKGHSSLLVQILRGVVQQLATTPDNQDPHIFLAASTDRQMLLDKIEQSLQILHTDSSHAQISEDPTLIGGYIVSYKDKRIDNSYKQKLVTLYRSLTK